MFALINLKQFVKGKWDTWIAWVFGLFFLTIKKPFKVENAT